MSTLNRHFIALIFESNPCRVDFFVKGVLGSLKTSNPSPQTLNSTP